MSKDIVEFSFKFELTKTYISRNKNSLSYEVLGVFNDIKEATDECLREAKHGDSKWNYEVFEYASARVIFRANNRGYWTWVRDDEE